MDLGDPVAWIIILVVLVFLVVVFAMAEGEW